jgi:hypothetical protein
MTLRVKLEIVPYGDEDGAYEIGRLDIFNKGLAEPTADGWDQGGYHQYGIIEMDEKSAGLHDNVVLHRRWDGGWQLVRKVLEELEIKGP